MRMLTVTDSDIIEAVGFAIDARSAEDPNRGGGVFGTLGVVFKSSPGDLYEYAGVPAQTFAKLVGGDSVGKAFHDLFRKTKYPFTKSARPTLKK